jgi:hypothetical protein
VRRVLPKPTNIQISVFGAVAQSNSVATSVFKEPAASIFTAEDESKWLLQNVGTCIPDYAVTDPKRQ